MFRTLLAIAGLLLLAPAVASAAPFGELRSRSIRDGHGCLRATGEPGGLVRRHYDDVDEADTLKLLRADATRAASADAPPTRSTRPDRRPEAGRRGRRRRDRAAGDLLGGVRRAGVRRQLPLDANGQLRLRRAGSGRLLLHPDFAPDRPPRRQADPRPRPLRRARRPPSAEPDAVGPPAPPAGRAAAARPRRAGPARRRRRRRHLADGPRRRRRQLRRLRDRRRADHGVGGRARDRVRAPLPRAHPRRCDRAPITVLTGSDDAGVLRRTTVELTP